MSPLSFIGNMIIGTIKTLFIGGIIIVIGVSGVLIITKPSDSSLDSEVKKCFDKKITKSKSGFEYLAKNIVSKAILTIMSKDIKDYIVIKVAEIKIADSEPMIFIGVFNRWIFAQ